MIELTPLARPYAKALVAEKVSCPASQFCGDIAKFFSDQVLDIIKMFDNWFTSFLTLPLMERSNVSSPIFIDRPPIIDGSLEK